MMMWKEVTLREDANKVAENIRMHSFILTIISLHKHFKIVSKFEITEKRSKNSFYIFLFNRNLKNKTNETNIIMNNKKMPFD